MKTPVRRGTLRALAATALGATLVVSTVLVSTLLATSAGATGTTPPWEPVGNPPEVGGLTFYNSSGDVITSGTINDDPVATYVQGNTVIQDTGTKADLGGYTPVVDVAPGAWTGVQFGGSNYPNSGAPTALAGSTLPLYTGVSGYSLSDLTTAYPNDDTSSDGYAGIYVLRLKTYSSSLNQTSTNYDVADISVNSTTGDWSLVYSPQATTTTTLETPTPASPQTSGASVTLTADVTDSSAPGTVQFESGDNPVGSAQPVSDGVATLTTTLLPVGDDSLTAVFTPTTGAAFTGSTSSPVSYTINPTGNATTTVLATPTPASPVTFGTSVNLSATVTSGVAGTITGNVQFESGGSAVGSPQPISGGTASLTTTALPVGAPDSLTAVYEPTGNTYATSTSGTVNYTVQPAVTTTTLAAPTPTSPVYVGTSVSLNATVTSTVSGTIAGTVQFESGGDPVGSAQTVSGGAASLTTTALPVGAPDVLTAVFTPTAGGNYATSTSTSVDYTVKALNATTTVLATPTPASPQPFGTSVALNATVSSTASGTVSGTVQFESDGSPVGSPQTVSGGAASLTTTALPVGAPDTVTAVYLPTAGNSFATSTSTSVDYTVQPAGTTTTLEPPTPTSPVYVGTSVTLNATVASSVSGTITGTVQFVSGTTDIGGSQTVSAGAASLTTTALPVGAPDSLTAVFTPSNGTNYATSTSTPVTYTVQPLNATTTVLATPTPASPQLSGASVTLGATVNSTVSGTLSGSVQFYSGTSPVGSPQTVSGGAASLTTTALPVGTDSLTAVYLPTAGNTFATSTSTPVTYTVQSTVTTPPAPPSGATSSQGASSSSPSGTATATVSGVSASGSGEGALTVAAYSGNPVAGSVSGATGVYYDVALSSGNTFGSVSITISNLGPGGQSIDWWNGIAWVPFSDQTYDAATNSVTVTVSATTSPTLAELNGTPIAVSSNPAPSRGYWEVASDGGVFSFGGASFYGSQGGKPLNAPIVGVAATPDGQGYWEVASDGGVFSFGDAKFYGSEGGKPLNAPIVGVAATPDGQGYWEVASDGGVFSFGDAKFYGSEGGKPLNAPIVGIAATPTGKGYWEVASDGGVFSFGDATFYGSQGGKPLNKPIVGIAATPTGNGYWEVASDGGIFNYGDAGFYGSQGGKPLNEPVVGAAAPAAGNGYWEVASDGGIFNYGGAGFFGSQGGKPLNAPIVGIAGA